MGYEGPRERRGSISAPLAAGSNDGGDVARAGASEITDSVRRVIRLRSWNFNAALGLKLLASR